MRAIVIEKFGGLDSLVYKEIPEPEPKAGHVVIQIKAFGINHAEMHMRRGEFPVGAKVAALMGGLGRTINGSPSTPGRRRRTSPPSRLIYPGPNSPRSPRPLRPRGLACSATSRSRQARPW